MERSVVVLRAGLDTGLRADCAIPLEQCAQSIPSARVIGHVSFHVAARLELIGAHAALSRSGAAAFIPHNAAGAVLPFAKRASVIAT